MSEFDTKHYRDLLENKLKDIDNTLQMMKKNKDADQDKYSPAELSNYDNHPAEMGTELFQVEHNAALRVHEEHLLKDIKDAIKRIDENKFGKCVFCGKDIGTERLEVLPYARLCIYCEEDKPILMKYGSADSPQDMGGYHDYDEYFTNEIDRQGIVDDMDRISNEEYKKQLPD